ncbi:ZN574 protein, partial [Bucco capensis]|nr:ZN574 protein [Bucco capensis]
MTKFLYHRRSHGAALKGTLSPGGALLQGFNSGANFSTKASGGVGSGNLSGGNPSSSSSSSSSPHRCVLCPKAFAKASQLARHQRFVHRLERRHRC